MRVRILSQHFAPEVTAGRYRVEAFAQRFAAGGHRVEVVCPVPNHPQGVPYEGYRGRPVRRVSADGATITYLRIWTSPKRTARARLLYYGSYAAAAAASGVAMGRPDLILASSPPLTVAAAAASTARLRRAPWIFDVRDLWPRAAELIGELTNPRLVRMAERLEQRLYDRADLITATTRPFVGEIQARVDNPEKVELVANGTTRTWLKTGEREVERAGLGLPPDAFIWTYAGNLGPSRRLDIAIEAARLLGEGFHLLLIGEGATLERLRGLAAKLPAGAVGFRDLMPAERAALYARASDALLVPQQPGLGDFVPSKLYDFSAVGRPLVAAADGETARLASEAGLGLPVPPENAEAIAAAIRRLYEEPELRSRLGASGRAFAEEHQRERQADRLVALAETLV